MGGDKRPNIMLTPKEKHLYWGEKEFYKRRSFFCFVGFFFFLLQTESRVCTWDLNQGTRLQNHLGREGCVKLHRGRGESPRSKDSGAASNDYFHYRLIRRQFSRLIEYLFGLWNVRKKWKKSSKAMKYDTKHWNAGKCYIWEAETACSATFCMTNYFSWRFIYFSAGQTNRLVQWSLQL